MRRWHWYVLLALVAVLATSPGAHAQSKTYHWDRIDVDIEVLPSGDFVVEETQQLTFTSGEFHFVFRGILMDRLESISNVEVWEGNRQYQPDGGDDEYAFSTYVEDNEFFIKWFFPYTSDSTHTFTLRYTVHGGLRYYEGGDQLFWKAVFSNRDFPVNGSTVRVVLPDGATADAVEAYGVRAQITGQGESAVTFEALEPIRPGQEFEVRVQFPHGIVAGTPPRWQVTEDKLAAWETSGVKAAAEVALAAIGALLAVLGPLGLIVLWYQRGRDPQVDLPSSYLTEPPSDDPPAVAGTLVDEKADMQDIVATLVDLARREYMVIEEERKAGIFRRSDYDFVFRRSPKPADDLLSFERRLLSSLFEGRSVRRMSDLRDKFYTAVPKIKKALYEEAVARGYFRGRPDEVRKRYAIGGMVLLMLSMVLGFCLFTILTRYVSMTICPAVGLGVTAIAAVIVGQFMPVKRREGAEMAARWMAFRDYLRQIDRHSDLHEAAALFERYLPFAVAFGLEDTWVRRFASVAEPHVPVPLWYIPAARHSVGGRSGSGAQPTAGGRGAVPSLQGMSDGMAGGLQSMSDGLSAMLNSAASTLASSPSSSGGGGFSGGGGSGGGGGGGSGGAG